jgi:hypothetical protein
MRAPLYAAGLLLLSFSTIAPAQSDLLRSLWLDCASPDEPAVAPAKSDRYVAHEWGTFTSYSGSDGVRLEFRPLVDQDLPNFVYNPSSLSGLNIFSKSVYRARQRMETPVIYFYTDKLRDVNVKVGFPQGLLTEFYPPPRRLEPAQMPAWSNRQTVEAEQLKGGLLDWGKVTLLPKSALRPNLADAALADAIAARAFAALPVGMDPEPELYTGDHYYYARDTDSSLVHVHLPANPESFRAAGDFFEKFLFYRGLGNFELPMTVSAPRAGRFQVTNRGTHALTGLILVQVDGEDIRFSRLDDVGPGATLSASAPPAYSGEQHVMTALREAMKATLVHQGLYEREANAMVMTWESSWFREQGTRLLYIVPRELTDELLPLTIDPPPHELVRVLVGRMDILPQDEERRIESLVAASASAREALAATEAARRQAHPEAPADAAPVPAVPDEIRQLGRLAEPALTRIGFIAKEPAVRTEAALLIHQLRSEDAAEE